MSDTTRLDFQVENDIYSKGKELVNGNRRLTSNSRDSKAFYGRTLYKLGIEKLEELEEKKEEKAIDFRKTENRIKQLIEEKGISGVQ